MRSVFQIDRIPRFVTIDVILEFRIRHDDVWLISNNDTELVSRRETHKRKDSAFVNRRLFNVQIRI